LRNSSFRLESGGRETPYAALKAVLATFNEGSSYSKLTRLINFSPEDAFRGETEAFVGSLLTAHKSGNVYKVILALACSYVHLYQGRSFTPGAARAARGITTEQLETADGRTLYVLRTFLLTALTEYRGELFDTSIEPTLISSVPEYLFLLGYLSGATMTASVMCSLDNTLLPVIQTERLEAAFETLEARPHRETPGSRYSGALSSFSPVGERRPGRYTAGARRWPAKFSAAPYAFGLHGCNYREGIFCFSIRACYLARVGGAGLSASRGVSGAAHHGPDTLGLSLTRSRAGPTADLLIRLSDTDGNEIAVKRASFAELPPESRAGELSRRIWSSQMYVAQASIAFESDQLEALASERLEDGFSLALSYGQSERLVPVYFTRRLVLAEARPDLPSGIQKARECSVCVLFDGE